MTIVTIVTHVIKERMKPCEHLPWHEGWEARIFYANPAVVTLIHSDMSMGQSGNSCMHASSGRLIVLLRSMLWLTTRG